MAVLPSRQLLAITIDRGDDGKRLDRVLRRHLTGVRSATRTRIQAWIAEGRASINGAVVRRSATRVPPTASLTLELPELALPTVMAAEALPLDVLYDDAWLLAVNKPPGIIVHPSYKHPAGTLMNALLWRARDWPTGERPSLVGRLDKLTSGVVIVARTREAHAKLQRALTSHDACKEYLAVVYGRVKSTRGEISARLRRDERDRRRVVTSTRDGVSSVTRYERLATIDAQRGSLSLLRCRLMTGRLHQIRVHLAASGWPIVGDPTYGQPLWNTIEDPEFAGTLRSFPRQALHAWRVAFTHPITGRLCTLETPLPSDIRELLAQIQAHVGLAGSENVGTWQAERL